MKKTLIRALSFCMILALLTGLMAPFASAIDYEGVEPITLEAAAGLLIDLDTDQVLYEQNADGQRYPGQHHQNHDGPAHPGGRGARGSWTCRPW